MALTPEYREAFRSQLWQIIERKPRYVWGGVDDVKGVDCSGYVYLAARRAAIPGVKRTTALRMAGGSDGWNHTAVGLFDVDELDLVWWTWSDRPGRTHGHIGVAVFGRESGLLEVTHASSARGVVVDKFMGKLLRDISKIGRLTHGDHKGIELLSADKEY